MNYNELKRLIGMLKLGNDLTSYAESKLMNFIKEQETEQLPIDVISSSFTFEEVENLLKTQRTNCVVAVMKYIMDDELLEKISDAPMYDYKKALKKK